MIDRLAAAGLLASLAASAPGAGHAARPTLEALRDIDQSFVCPETLADDAARLASLKVFFAAFAKAEPDKTPSDMLLYRRQLLEKHGCRQTLARIAGADAAMKNGDVQRQAWLPLNGLPGAELYMSTDHLNVVLDPRFPNERAVDAYSKLVFAAPRETDVTHVRYDQVVSHTIYYCQSRRYALVENDYFLGDRETLKDPSAFATVDGVKVYPITPTLEDSFNARAEAWACGSAKGGVS